MKLQGNIGTLRGSREGNDISGNVTRGQNNRGSADPTNRGDGDNVFHNGNQAPSDDSYFFKNEMKEVALTAVFTLGNISFIKPLRKVQMFMFAGVGTIWSDVNGGFGVPDDAKNYHFSWGDDYFNLVTDGSGDIIDAQTTYQGRNFTLPFGFGFKRNFGDMLDVGIEYRLNYTRSDNLDAYSYPLWRNRHTDFYGLLGFQASLKLGGMKRSPTITIG